MVAHLQVKFERTISMPRKVEDLDDADHFAVSPYSLWVSFGSHRFFKRLRLFLSFLRRCWRTDTEALEQEFEKEQDEDLDVTTQYGLGVSLYFKHLKVIALGLAFMVVLYGIPSMIFFW